MNRQELPKRIRTVHPRFGQGSGYGFRPYQGHVRQDRQGPGYGDKGSHRGSHRGSREAPKFYFEVSRLVHASLTPPEPPIQSATRSPTQSGDPVTRLLAVLVHGEMASGKLREALGIKHRPTFRDNYLHPALEAGFIEYTVSDKPQSRLQKYRLTEKGRAWLKKAKQ